MPAFQIPRFAHLDRAVAVDLHEVAVFDHAAHALAIWAKGGDEGGQDDHARFHEEFGDLEIGGCVVISRYCQR